MVVALSLVLLLTPQLAEAAPADASQRRPIVIHVDPSRDARTARIGPDRTVATLHEAIAMLRRLRANGARGRGAVIELAAGIHRLAEPVTIAAELGGDAGAPLIIRGAPDGSTTISGSVSLKPMARPLPRRLSAAQRERVLAFALPSSAARQPSIAVHRIHPTPAAPIGLELFDSRGALQPARWPDAGWAQVHLPPGKAGLGENDRTILVDGGRAKTWIGEPDLWVVGYLGQDWSFETIAAAASEPYRLALSEPPHYDLREGDRYAVENALSELDAPGEWYRDAKAAAVYVIPRGGRSDTIEVSIAAELIRLDHASHVRFENITFERSRGDAVIVTGGDDVLFRDVTIRWAAGRGLVIDGATRSGLMRSVITDTGEGGVSLQGGDRSTLTRADDFVQDSIILRFARLGRTYKDAVAIEGVGMRVTGNVIAHAPHLAIRFQGNDHVIASNEIFDVVNDTSDAGAIYTGRDVSAQGTVLRDNYLHDIQPARGAGGKAFEVKGIYLDDLASGTTIDRNVFLRVDQPVFIGGGRDNIVTGNLFVASSPALALDGRGKVWPSAPVDSSDNPLYAASHTVPTTGALWSRRYPGLSRLMQDDPLAAKHNVFRDNVLVASGAPEIGQGARPADQILANNREIASSPLVSTARRARDLASFITPPTIGPALPIGDMDRLSRLGEIDSLRRRATEAGLALDRP